MSSPLKQPYPTSVVNVWISAVAVTVDRVLIPLCLDWDIAMCRVLAKLLACRLPAKRPLPFDGIHLALVDATLCAAIYRTKKREQLLLEPPETGACQAHLHLWKIGIG